MTELETPPTFRDTLYTISKDGHRRFVYPEPVIGHYFKIRRVVAWCLVFLYCGLPWILIKGQQAVFLDIAHRKFTFFGTTFWATDSFLLFCILSSLALSLFFFTAILGRMWCGWACPQTVFLEFVYRPIERFIEGRASERKRRDAGPWTSDKIVRKLVKLAAYGAVSWILASTALAYLIGRKLLLEMMTGSPLAHPFPFFATIIWSLLLVFEFGWFREQFCTVVCPYARFQSVLLDPHSRVVAYDVDRGEPRGKKESGDCIDCGACVRVCPTGIDIRNGLQLECIHCTQCIDACHDIMKSVDLPTGLIRYTSGRQLAGLESSPFRARTLLYALLIGVILSAGGVYLFKRTDGEFKIVRGGKDTSFTILGDGRISNHLHLFLSDRGTAPIGFTVSAAVPAGLEVLTPISPFVVQPGDLQELPLFVNFPKDLLVQGKREASIRVSGTDGSDRTVNITLLGPE